MNKLHLLQNLELLQGVFYHAVDGIIVIDGRGVMQLANPAVAKLFGYSIEEMIGQNVSMLMPQPHRKQHDGYIHQYKTTGDRKIIGIGREVKGQRKDGSLFPFNLSVSEIESDGKRLFTGIIHDISEQKAAQKSIELINSQLELKVEERTERLAEVVNKLLETNNNLKTEIQERQEIEAALRESEEEVKKTLAKERELSELKTRFVSTASHEFRTPLSTILSSAALIERYTDTAHQDKRVRHISRIKSSVKNLIGILDDFLSVSKLEEGRIDMQQQLFRLGELVDETLEETKVFAKKGQTFDYQQTHLHEEVCLDQRFVKNILINLLSNAIKYSEENKTIRLETTIKAKHVIIRVADEGIGIPETEQVHLFERFFRAKNASAIQGTGLGLNIVKKYVDLMEGTIHFESAVNQGTTFTVTFPNNLQ